MIFYRLTFPENHNKSKKMKKIVSLLLVVVFFCSCNEYQKALKTEDVAVKFEMATQLYDAGKYAKAIRLFEQIAPSYRGKPQAEKLFYMFAQSYYKTEQYKSNYGCRDPKERRDACSATNLIAFVKLRPNIFIF